MGIISLDWQATPQSSEIRNNSTRKQISWNIKLKVPWGALPLAHKNTEFENIDTEQEDKRSCQAIQAKNGPSFQR